jgi:hypothetical protein
MENLRGGTMGVLRIADIKKLRGDTLIKFCFQSIYLVERRRIEDVLTIAAN